MSWQARVNAALRRLHPDDRDWLNRLPPRERAFVIMMLVELDARVV